MTSNTSTNLLSLLAAFVTAACSVQAATIIDGDFESPVVPGGPGATMELQAGSMFGNAWTVDTAQVSLVLIKNGHSSFYATPDGGQFAYLGNSSSASTLSQDITQPLIGGTSYTLEFLQSGLTSPIAGRVNVQIAPTGGGAPIFDSDFLVPSQSDWVQRSATIPVVDSASYTLKFSSFSGSVGVIDRVAMAPEPTTALFLCVGIALLVTRRNA
jgi:hypothetical protein